jgi:hypothetical protein
VGVGRIRAATVQPNLLSFTWQISKVAAKREHDSGSVKALLQDREIVSEARHITAREQDIIASDYRSFR